ncbi:hypothetical protein MWK26_05530, partial [Escherichia coli]|nr:hypothetical protein [Escherichia coli]
QNDVTLKMPAFEWVHVQLHQQKGMISLSPPTICNSAFLHMLVEKPPHFARSVRYTVARDKIFCCCMLHTLHYTKSGLFNQ